MGDELVSSLHVTRLEVDPDLPKDWQLVPFPEKTRARIIYFDEGVRFGSPQSVAERSGSTPALFPSGYPRDTVRSAAATAVFDDPRPGHEDDNSWHCGSERIEPHGSTPGMSFVKRLALKRCRQTVLVEFRRGFDTFSIMITLGCPGRAGRRAPGGPDRDVVLTGGYLKGAAGRTWLSAGDYATTRGPTLLAFAEAGRSHQRRAHAAGARRGRELTEGPTATDRAGEQGGESMTRSMRACPSARARRRGAPHPRRPDPLHPDLGAVCPRRLAAARLVGGVQGARERRLHRGGDGSGRGRVRRRLREGGRLRENGLLLLAKYVDAGSSGSREWVRTLRLNGARADKVAVDARGNVVVAGTSNLADTGRSNIFVLKYSPAGVLKWRAAYDGAEHRDDYVTDLALDARGNALVVGASYGKGTGRDYVTLKVRADGTRAWARRYAGPDFYDVPEASPSTRPATSTSPATRGARPTSRATPARTAPSPSSTAPSGARLWLAIVGQRRNAGGSAVMVSPDAQTVVVSGWRDVPAEWVTVNQFFVKYDASSGKVVWMRMISGSAETNLWPAAAGMDASGAPVAAGLSNPSGGYRATSAASRRAAGTHGWARSRARSPVAAGPSSSTSL